MNLQILDQRLLTNDWEYDASTETLVDFAVSQAYKVSWAEIVQTTSGATTEEERLQGLCDCIYRIIEHERAQRPITQVGTSKARMPTMSEMLTPPISPAEATFVVSPGYTKDQSASSNPQG